MTPDEGDAEIAQNFVIGEAGMKAHILSRPMWHFPLIRLGRTLWMCVVLSRHASRRPPQAGIPASTP
jgi:hypothetical protein